MDEGPLLNEDEGDGQLYVVETDKSNYVFKNPSTIQFTVYNHAKNAHANYGYRCIARIY